VKIESDASTAAGLRALVASLDKMEIPDDAPVTGRGLRSGPIILSVEVGPE